MILLLKEGLEAMSKYISVIIPTYNNEKTIIKTLDSLEKQSFRDFEVIIVNDGSSDNSEKVINEYIKNKENFKQIYKKNSGVSETRNYGLEIATGRYITFIDSDDYIENDYFENFVNDCETNDLIVYGYVQISQTKKEKIFLEKDCSLLNKKEIYELLSQKNMFNIVWNKFFKKELIKNIRFDSSFDIGEDMDFVIKFISQKKCKKIKVVNKCFYNYILSPNGLGFKVRSDTFLTKYKIYKNLIAFYEENNFSREYIDKILFKAYLSGFVTLNKSKKLDKNSMIHYVDECNKLINFSSSSISNKYKVINCLINTKIIFLITMITISIDLSSRLIKKIKYGL